MIKCFLLKMIEGEVTGGKMESCSRIKGRNRRGGEGEDELRIFEKITLWNCLI